MSKHSYVFSVSHSWMKLAIKTFFLWSFFLFNINSYWPGWLSTHGDISVDTFLTDLYYKYTLVCYYFRNQYKYKYNINILTLLYFVMHKCSQFLFCYFREDNKHTVRSHFIISSVNALLSGELWVRTKVECWAWASSLLWFH